MAKKKVEKKVTKNQKETFLKDTKAIIERKKEGGVFMAFREEEGMRFVSFAHNFTIQDTDRLVHNIMEIAHPELEKLVHSLSKAMAKEMGVGSTPKKR